MFLWVFFQRSKLNQEEVKQFMMIQLHPGDSGVFCHRTISWRLLCSVKTQSKKAHIRHLDVLFEPRSLGFQNYWPTFKSNMGQQVFRWLIVNCISHNTCNKNLWIHTQVPKGRCALKSEMWDCLDFPNAPIWVCMNHPLHQTIIESVQCCLFIQGFSSWNHSHQSLSSLGKIIPWDIKFYSCNHWIT